MAFHMRSALVRAVILLHLAVAVHGSALPQAELVPGMPTTVISDDDTSGFHTMATHDPIIDKLTPKFMNIYQGELSRSSLQAKVVTVLRAEQTDLRLGMEKQELIADPGTNELRVGVIQEANTRQLRIFLLLQYSFASNMQDARRPYVSAMRVTMNCFNPVDADETATATAAAKESSETDSDRPLSCDVVEYLDLPRRNESVVELPEYVHRQIAHAALVDNVAKPKRTVIVDSMEAQDLAFNDYNQAIVNADALHFIRFHVADTHDGNKSETTSSPLKETHTSKQGDTEDDKAMKTMAMTTTAPSASGEILPVYCIAVVQGARGFDTLRYHDSICYKSKDGALMGLAEERTAMSELERVTRQHLPLFAALAASIGALVTMAVIWRRRRRQRTGYSYVHSDSGKLTHVPTQSSTVNTDAAMPC